MNAGISDIDARTLFKLKGWKILRSSWNNKNMFPVCFALHSACNPSYEDRAGNANGIRRNICFRCGDSVPDEIQGLVALTNWET